MSAYAAEPVPQGVEPVTAAYLDRQFNAIGLALTPEGRLVVPTVGTLPPPIAGAIVYLLGDGMYACISTEAEGVAEWKRLESSQQDQQVDLSGKTWNDFT